MGGEKKKLRSLSTSSSSSSSSDDERRLKKLKKKLKKEQRRSEKLLKKKIKAEKKKLKTKEKEPIHNITLDPRETARESKIELAADIPVELMERSKAMAPMTKEEWDKRQSVVRRVFDEDSGRYRLIKGDGEVIEEIVSRNRHKQINLQATQADGAFFQAQTVEKRP